MMATSYRQRLRERWEQWALPVLLLVAFALRIFRLGTLEFWLDEAYSSWFAAMGAKKLLAYLVSAPFEHPPGYYLLLSPWQRWAGSGEFSLRWFSLFWGMLTIPLLYQLTRRLAGRRLALLVTLLATFSPFLVAYSQEARMYSLLPCLAILGLLTFHHAVLDKKSGRWWLAYSMLLTFGVAVHYYFVLIWAATAAYVLVERPRRRSVWLWTFAVQPLFLVAPLVWLVAMPGPRSSLHSIMGGATAFGLAHKLNKVMPVLMASEVRPLGVTPTSGVLAAAGWVLVLLGVLWSRRSGAMGRSAWRFLLLLLVVPLSLSLLIPYGVLGRHLGYLLAAVLPFAALGLESLARSGKFFLAMGCLGLVLLAGYGLGAQYNLSKGEVGEALHYINEDALPGDVLVATQPLESHLVDYYNDREWPVEYFPSLGEDATPAQAEELMVALAATHDRIWLGPTGAWTADPESLVEHWLVSHFFQAEKVWFAGSESVGLYFAPTQLQPVAAADSTEWEDQIRLVSAEVSTYAVQPGDAVRLSFGWQAVRPAPADFLVSLDLVDSSGTVWARRTSAPCGGLCPSSKWGSAVIEDHHALRIPEGTPPGTYQLRAGLYNAAEGRSLQAEDGREWLELGTVHVIRAGLLTPDQVRTQSVQQTLNAVFGSQLQLIGLDLAQSQVFAGQATSVDLHWLVQETPSGDATLRWELVGSDGELYASWDRPPVAAFYPTSLWQPGEILRSSQSLSIPGGVPAGRYWLRLLVADATGQPMPVSGSRRLQIVDGLIQGCVMLRGQYLEVAKLQVSDRARSYAVPAFAHARPARLAQQVELLGYDLDTAAFAPGGQLTLTLYWLAGGPTEASYKVFVHLGDAVHPPVAQGDGFPGGGCCPTDTWVKGEVVRDRHVIRLPSDLPAGYYRLTVGMYDPGSADRLAVESPVQAGVSGNQILLTGLAVRATPVPSPTGPPQKVERLFLPLVARDR